MSLLDLLDDYLFGPMNLINRFEGRFRLLLAQDGGQRFAILRQDKGGQHSLSEVQALLQRYHIATFGCTHDAQHLYFMVKARQASWAEYLLLCAGVDMRNPKVDPRNVERVARRSSSAMPVPWDERNRETEKAPSPLSQPQPPKTKQANSLSSQFTQLIASLFE